MTPNEAVSAGTPTPDPISNAVVQIERARAEVYRICQASRGEKWRMSVPVRPEYDSDCLITDGLNAAYSLLTLAREGLEARNAPPPDDGSPRWLTARLAAPPEGKGGTDG